MQRVLAIVTGVLACSSAACAATHPEAGKSGLLLWIFLAFIGAVVVLQFVPGIILFVNMLKGLLFSAEKKESKTKNPLT